MMATRIRTVWLVVLVTSASLAGQARAAGTPTNACGLLTKAEITAAIAEPLKSAQGGKSATGAIYCNWLGNDTHLFSKGISLIAASDSVAKRYSGYVAMLDKKTPVTGVGVAAVTDGNVIVARSARGVVQIGATYVNSGITLATVKALAKKALARV